MQDFILTVYIVTVYNTVNDQFYSIIYRFMRRYYFDLHHRYCNEKYFT